jgi:hypothetical protein
VNIENEVEAPRNDAFGLSAIHAERHRKKVERIGSIIFKWGMILCVLIGFQLITYHTFAMERVHWIDHAENCLVVEYREGGKVKHRNTHCPALTEEGTLGWPLGK